MSYLAHFVRSWKTMFLVGLLVAVMSGALSLLKPLEYRADTQVFILSRTPAGVDPFTLAKTAERIGANLTQLVYTSSFFEQVMAVLSKEVSREQFGSDERAVRARWQNAVSVNVVGGTGFLHVSAFHEDPRQAGAIAQAVAATLVDKGWEYVGGEVQIKKVDNVVLSRFPVRPNIPMNMLMGFVLGVCGVLLALFFQAPRHGHGGALDWLRHL